MSETVWLLHLAIGLFSPDLYIRNRFNIENGISGHLPLKSLFFVAPELINLWIHLN
jgi:hypothetical protein